jgi:hypothetical protein
MTENERTRKTISAAIQSGDVSKIEKALKAWLGPATKDTLSESLKQAGNETRKPA